MEREAESPLPSPASPPQRPGPERGLADGLRAEGEGGLDAGGGKGDPCSSSEPGWHHGARRETPGDLSPAGGSEGPAGG